jgi:hypothetical protein
MSAYTDTRRGSWSAVRELERHHPWLFNIAVGLLLGIVGWYLFRNAWAVFVLPFIWAPIRIASLRGRLTE